MKLNPLHLPIQGYGLIEAAAGTGKTHTIVSLVLRLLLGHDSELRRIDEILIVTFTRAAAMELRDRLRSRLREARDAFMDNKPPVDEFLAELKKSPDDPKLERDIKLLQAAIEQVDEAAVFTIHGFCYRLLTDFSFASSLLVQHQYALDISPYQQLAVEQFWRHYTYSLPADLNRTIRHFCADPEKLQKTLRSCLELDLVSVKGDRRKSIQAVACELEQTFVQVIECWQAGVREEIETSYISKRQGTGGHADSLDEFDRWAATGGKLILPNNTMAAAKLLAIYHRDVLLHPKNCNKTGEEPSLKYFLEATDKAMGCYRELQATFYGAALRGIQEYTQAAKETYQVIGPDDVLRLTTHILQQPLNQRFGEQVRARYPVAFIDEFQDTDSSQWAIFNQLYPDNTGQSALVMIGDPKQAIFGFRGADLNTYLRARRQVPVKNRAIASINWRSSVAMVAAVNALYAGHSNPFANTAIEFTAVQPQPDACRDSWCLQGQPQPPLQFLQEFLPSSSKTTNRAKLARQAIDTLIEFFNNEATIDGRPLQYGDVTFLVNDRYEADALRSVLRSKGLASAWHSRNSVFSSTTAEDLSCILNALLANDERLIRTALATRFFGQPLPQLYQELTDEKRWAIHLERFEHYRQLWQAQKLMTMLQKLLQDYGLTAIHLRRGVQGARTLTDFRQLGELLQQQMIQLGSMHQLQRWFNSKLGTEAEVEAYRIRLESDANLVQIATIHSAKGLQYEVVVLPFGIKGQSEQNSLLIHTSDSATLDLGPDKKTRVEGYKRSLAESLRLLYVALTRAKHACYVLIGDLNPKNSESAWHSLRHVLLPNSTIDPSDAAEEISTRLQTLSNQHPCIAYRRLDLPEATRDSSDTSAAQPADQLDAEQGIWPFVQQRPFTGTINRNWEVSSYSRLTAAVAADFRPGWGDEIQANVQYRDAGTGIEAKFPKGAKPGLCLHDILEHWPSTKEQELAHIETMLKQHAMRLSDDYNADTVLHWLRRVRQTPLTMGASLKAIQHCIKEMQFCLPIADVDTMQLRSILKRHGYNAEQLSQSSLYGMLQGYIDMVFEHDGKFWVIDYKSNWLGGSIAEYSHATMEHAIYSHRYDLQFLLYSVAVIRLLAVRQSKACAYDSFGGVCYLFLRGMDGANNTGIYPHYPGLAILHELDDLFAGRGH